MMAAGVDAAGDLDLEVADLVLAFQVAEALGDALGDRDGSRVGEVAVVEPGAGDDVGEKPGVGRDEAVGVEQLPHLGEVSEAPRRQHPALPIGRASRTQLGYRYALKSVVAVPFKNNTNNN